MPAIIMSETSRHHFVSE